MSRRVIKKHWFSMFQKTPPLALYLCVRVRVHARVCLWRQIISCRSSRVDMFETSPSFQRRWRWVVLFRLHTDTQLYFRSINTPLFTWDWDLQVDQVPISSKSIMLFLWLLFVGNHGDLCSPWQRHSALRVCLFSISFYLKLSLPFMDRLCVLCSTTVLLLLLDLLV